MKRHPGCSRYVHQIRLRRCQAGGGDDQNNNLRLFGCSFQCQTVDFVGADGVSVWLDPVYGHNVAMPHSEGPDRRCGCQSLFGRARDRRCDGPAVASGVLGRRERLCQ